MQPTNENAAETKSADKKARAPKFRSYQAIIVRGEEKTPATITATNLQAAAMAALYDHAGMDAWQSTLTILFRGKDYTVSVASQLPKDQRPPKPLAVKLHRDLTEAEMAEFRAAAREKFHGGDIDPLWHPVYRDECLLILKELAEAAATAAAATEKAVEQVIRERETEAAEESADKAHRRAEKRRR